MAEPEKSWEKRLAGEPDELTIDFVESLSIDKRLYKYDIVGSIAHARMLSEQKLITKDEFNSIKDGLIEISEEIAAGRMICSKEVLFLERIKWPKQKEAGKSGLRVSRMS